jgi:hypothetical protein
LVVRRAYCYDLLLTPLLLSNNRPRPPDHGIHHEADEFFEETEFGDENILVNDVEKIILKVDNVLGEFHDQGDAKWIVIRGQLRGHNDTPFGRPTPGRPIGRPGVGHPQGVFGGLSYY